VAAAGWTASFTRRLILALPLAVLAWAIASPIYNRVLVRLVEPAVRLFESPDRTTLYVRGYEQMMITHTDYGAGQGYLAEVRLPDVHFTWILGSALALATPGVARGERLRRLAIAGVWFLFFHVFLLAMRVEFVYATQLGAWSLARYGPVARETIGIVKHTLDLPLKLAMPFAVWWALFYPELRAGFDTARR
jgi:hypothetical protein